MADRWLIFPVAVRVRPGWLVAPDAPVFNCDQKCLNWFRTYKYCKTNTTIYKYYTQDPGWLVAPDVPVFQL